VRVAFMGCLIRAFASGVKALRAVDNACAAFALH
jgi:hypothetical protein